MMKKLSASPLIWPVLALVALLIVNVIVTPTFLSIRVQDGHLFGSTVDILRNGAPTMLVALGMTLVIASRGIDVGAKAQIQKLVTDLAKDGMGVVFISAELDEVARISDRIAVLRDGKCVAQVGSDRSVRELTALIAAGGGE